MSNNLNDISKIYLDQIANINKKDLDKDVDRWTQTEAVKGQDSEMRRIKASERGTDADTRNPDDPTGKNYATGKRADVAWWKKKSQKESFSNWRTDLREVIDEPITDTEDLKKVDVKKGIKNKVIINPKLTEAIAELGGQLLEVTETEEKPKEDPQLAQKSKRQSQLKKQVLMRKLNAVRQGGGEDIVAGYEPEGEALNEAKKPKNCGCGQDPCITYGKGDKKKGHNCASKVKHEEYGIGNCIKEMHTLDEDGHVTHYDIMFSNRIIKNVPASSLEILEGMYHEHYVNEEKNKENFTPHKMIDPSTKKVYMANTYEEHKKYKEKGYVHEAVVLEKDLNAAERRALPNKDFVFPGKGEGPEGKQRGAYPINDKKHARAALAMAAAHASPEKEAKVKAAVKKKYPDIEVSEAKVDKGRSDYGKATIRNWRHSGPSTVDPAMFDPENKRGKTIDKRREEHKARRGVKGAKVPTYTKEEVIGEEGYDRMRDDRLVKYGIGHDGSDRKGPSPRPTGKQPKGDTVYQKEMKKKYGGKLPSALQVVTDKIRERHGKGAIADAK